jgi:hypothetical protein
VVTNNMQCDDLTTCDPDPKLAVFFANSCPMDKPSCTPSYQPDNQIFETNWADVSFTRLLGTKFVRVAEVETVTVRNDVYGVAPNTTVRVLLLSLDGPIPIQGGIDTTASMYRALGEYAEDATKEAVVFRMREWLAGL